MRWLAPAKVNLSLRILGKRSDGFHELESLMVPVSLFDALELEHLESGDLQFSCSDPTVPSDESNLVVKAARLFCSSVGLMPRLKIRLEKEIPHGAGLGGGSSDAATTLLALNALFETRLDREALGVMASELGSDVPFFIYQSAAWIRGRGERVEPISGIPAWPVLLVKPSFGVSTPWAYQQWRDSIAIPGVWQGAQSVSSVTLINDLERPVFQKHLFLADLKNWLLMQPEVRGALMSGSGSTVFAVLDQREDGYALGERLAQEFGTSLWVYLCETIP